MRSVPWIRIALAAVVVIATVGCERPKQRQLGSDSTGIGEGRVTQSFFGQLPDGERIDVFTLTNEHGLEVRAITYGGIIVSIKTPDRNGRLDDIVLGFDSLDGYLKDSPYFGAIVGRYANRVARGRFTLDGKTYQLAINNGPNHLHGGIKGFDKVVWRAQPFDSAGVGVVFTHTSPDGDEGYPGNLTARVSYRLTNDNDLIVEYSATTDKATPINLSQHSYFNLGGAGTADVLTHVLRINADSFTPVDSTLIPLGTIVPVAGTPFDFRRDTTIGSRIDREDLQLRNGKGYDHNFVLNRDGGGLVLAARVREPKTGRTLEVRTTEPGLQFYSGNFLDGSITGKSGRVYPRRSGFCLETQHYPDSPNHPNFPSTILHPGTEYHSQTIFRFGVAH
jgi:aldose 1-epimerase